MNKIFSEFFSEQLHSPGERVKALRKSLGITRKEFAEKYGFSNSTLRAAEQSVRTLTPVQLQKLVGFFLQEGLQCSEEWIQTGKGSHPFKENQSDTTDPSSLFNPISEEVMDFKKHNPQSLIHQLEDESMSPLYKKGDYVAGNKVTRSLKPFDYGQPHIVVLSDGFKLVRTLYPSHQKGHFNLTAINLLEPVEQPFHTNINPKAIYKIIWHRRVS